MNGTIEFLRGKKTYLVMLIGILTALVAYLDGGLTGKEFVAAAFAAIGGATMRAGIKSGSLQTATFLICGGLAGLLLTGCAAFKTVQTDISYDPTTGKPIRAVTTRASARTFFEAKSALANFKASQTDKTQSASVGSLTQEATATNAVTLIEAVAKGAVKGALEAQGIGPVEGALKGTAK